MRNVTDVSTFTDPVTVCQDGDPGAEASFTPTAQALSNRTRQLKNRMDAEHNADGTHDFIHGRRVALNGHAAAVDGEIAADRLGLGGAVPGFVGQIAASSLVLSSNASVGGQVAASQVVAGARLDGVDDNGVHMRSGWGMFQSTVSTILTLTTGGAQDIDISFGHTWQIPAMDIFIDGSGSMFGIQPFINTIKFGAGAAFEEALVLVRVRCTDGFGSTFTLKHATAGSFSQFLGPDSADITWAINGGSATRLHILLRRLGTAYGNFYELVSYNKPHT